MVMIQETINTIVSKVKALGKNLEMKMSFIDVKQEQDKRIQLAIKEVESFASKNVAALQEMEKVVRDYQVRLESLQSIKISKKERTRKSRPVTFNQKELH